MKITTIRKSGFVLKVNEHKRKSDGKVALLDTATQTAAGQPPKAHSQATDQHGLPMDDKLSQSANDNQTTTAIDNNTQKKPKEFACEGVQHKSKSVRCAEIQLKNKTALVAISHSGCNL